ncbi:MAG TPA: ABC transporter permease subunit [Candidatus Methylomirabilis sp.]|nr:ABC transporter permease subunit [Candidatus Methylomirabilis sp.]
MRSPAHVSTGSKGGWARRAGGVTPWLFLAPYVLVFLAFFFLPALWSAAVSLTDWKIVGTPRFVGLKNYTRLFGDPLFFTALQNTVVYTAVIVPVMALLGLTLALLLNQPLRGRVLTRTSVFASYVVMVSVVGIIWRWVLDPTGAGIVNYYLGRLGVAPLPWLAAPETAMLSIIIATMWWTAGYNMVMYLAGLQDIPGSLREAVRIDGASRWQEFWNLTLPMLRPVTFFVVVMSIAKSFQVFGQVYVMTQGGPSNSTLTIVNYLYVVGFTWFQMGYAAAIAYALFALLLAVTVVQFRLVSRESGGAGFVLTGLLVRTGLYLLMGLVLVVWVSPLLWMLSTSLKPEGQILSLVPRWIPRTLTLENYRDVLEKYALVRWGLNSLVVSAGATILGLAVSVPAAYAFARMRFRGRHWLFLFILSTILVPAHITMVPLFLGLAKLRLTDTYFSLIMPTVANGFGVFLLRQFFQNIPLELEEAAIMDGASRLGVLLRVVLPLSRPPLMAVAIFTFILSWNDFMWPLIVTNTDATRTLPVGLAASLGGSVGGQAIAYYGMSMAGSVLATVPALLIFILLQRYFVEGIALTGLKG